ncbi:MAG: SufD family Fe-S cluster assembly protein [Lachnospiraceae bacterium]|nr:SufD family Fe-S cluster assembly protein [Lachnospiraceae bacterium]
METIVNKPLANTFGWLNVNGTKVNAPDKMQQQEYELEEGAERTIIADFAAGSRISAKLGRNATLRLVQIRRGKEEDTAAAAGNLSEGGLKGADGTAVNDVRVKCSEGARFEWYRIVLGGEATYDNCTVELEGDRSSFEAQIGYRLGGEQVLDVNCEAIHTGKKTDSVINASGVLSEKASKLMRGTIDLRKGCKGAVGNELEDVLLMDRTVRNRSIPVILCSEEDVVGNHGATIGRLDEDMIFYLASRGMETEAIYEMMAKAKLDSVIRRIPDEEVRRGLLEE